MMISMIQYYHAGKPSSKRFQLCFPVYIKSWYKQMRNSLLQPRNLTRYSRKESTRNCCDHEQILTGTKDCLNDITGVIPKLIEVKFRKSPGNINHLTFSLESTKLCIMLREDEKFNFFQGRVVLQAKFSPRNSPGWIQPG